MSRESADARPGDVHEQGASEARGVRPTRRLPLGPDRRRRRTSAPGHDRRRCTAVHPGRNGPHPFRALQDRWSAPAGRAPRSRGEMIEARRLLAGLALAVLVATAFAPACADQPPIALAPIEIALDGKDEIVGVVVAADGTRYASDRGAGVVYRVTEG